MVKERVEVIKEHRPVEKEFVVRQKGGALEPGWVRGWEGRRKRGAAWRRRHAPAIQACCAARSCPSRCPPTPAAISPRQVETRQTGVERALPAGEVEHLGTTVSLGGRHQGATAQPGRFAMPDVERCRTHCEGSMMPPGLALQR